MEDGKWSEPKTGSPQGSVISPLLANIYLYSLGRKDTSRNLSPAYAFELWVDVWRKKWAQGEVVVVRYADDIILGFQYQTDADRFVDSHKPTVVPVTKAGTGDSVVLEVVF